MKNFILLVLSALILGCSTDKIAERADIKWQNIYDQLQEAFILAESGDTINIPAGHFHFDKSLLLDDKDSIVIIGAGIDKSVLSFKAQSEGAEGIKVSNCTGIQFIDFTIEDAAGDNIKVNDTDGITFRRVKAQWTGAVNEENGAYAFYPVLCKNVLIENCIAMGASDAGIYVGQSDTVIIRNNIAELNVAGIESENSNMVEIYGNRAERNTGGILVFDLPGLTQYGANIKVYDNVIRSNNYRNFAPEGNIVGVVPPGTGLMVLATKEVEIADNIIKDNRTVGIAVISYELVAAISKTDEDAQQEEGSTQTVNNNYKLDESYNPFPSAIRIKDNKLSNSHWFATFSHDFGKLFNFKFPFNPPDIVFDGFVKAGLNKTEILCIHQPGNSFVNLDAPNDLDNINENVEEFVCE